MVGKGPTDTKLSVGGVTEDGCSVSWHASLNLVAMALTFGTVMAEESNVNAVGVVNIVLSMFEEEVVR